MRYAGVLRQSLEGGREGGEGRERNARRMEQSHLLWTLLRSQYVGEIGRAVLHIQEASL